MDKLYKDDSGRLIYVAGDLTPTDIEAMMYGYDQWIGKQVCKRRSGKPFKSGEKINTVKGIVNHPQLNIPAFTFFEDDSYVECRKCQPV